MLYVTGLIILPTTAITKLHFLFLILSSSLVINGEVHLNSLVELLLTLFFPLVILSLWGVFLTSLVQVFRCHLRCHLLPEVAHLKASYLQVAGARHEGRDLFHS